MGLFGDKGEKRANEAAAQAESGRLAAPSASPYHATRLGEEALAGGSVRERLAS